MANVQKYHSIHKDENIAYDFVGLCIDVCVYVFFLFVNVLR